MDILSHEEELRYNRQIILRKFDYEGQEALKSAKILILGAGGLGCASSQYLVAAGVGEITLVDFDTVELSNLQRQVLHNDDRIGSKKVESAKASLESLNPHAVINTIDRRLEDAELDTLISAHSLVMDCSDNVDTRNQLNRLCLKHKVPLVSGAAIRFEGQVAVFTWEDDEPCYGCLSQLFGAQALSCVEAGIMSPVVGIIGATQALEAIKVVAGMGNSLKGQVMIFDGIESRWMTMKLPKLPGCNECAG